MSDISQILSSPSFGQIRNYMKKTGETTIANIAYATGFSQPTVAGVIKAGIKENLFLKLEIAGSSGGRRPQLYSVNKNFSYAILILVENKEISYEVCNYVGDIMCAGKKAISLSNLLKEINILIEKMGLVYENLNKCGISVPCVISDGKIVDWNKYKLLNGVNIKEEIAKESNIEVFVENDMRIFSIACTKYVPDYKNSLMAVVCVKKDILGMGALYNGNLIRGFSGFAGEISFVPFQWNLFYSSDKAQKIIQTIIAIYNPANIVVHMENKKENIDTIISNLKKKMPELAMPKFIMVDDIKKDSFTGLFDLCWATEQV